MSNTVKTWRVTRDQLKVGNSSRLFGELIPEAADWPPHTTAAYERSGYIEKVFVSQEEFDEFKKTQEEKAKPKSKKRVVKKSTSKKEKTSGGREDGSREGSGSEPEAGREEGGEEDDSEARELAEQSV